MDEYGYNQREVARRGKLAEVSVWRWLHGTPISARGLEKLANAFGITPDEFCPEYDGFVNGCNIFSGEPCGMKRALEIINGEEEDYPDNPTFGDYLQDHEHLAAHSYTPPVPHISHTGKYVQ